MTRRPNNNNWGEFSPLCNLQLHGGNYENALRAVLQHPPWYFDGDILEASLAVTKSPLEDAMTEPAQFMKKSVRTRQELGIGSRKSGRK